MDARRRAGRIWVNHVTPNARESLMISRIFKGCTNLKFVRFAASFIQSHFQRHCRGTQLRLPLSLELEWRKPITVVFSLEHRVSIYYASLQTWQPARNGLCRIFLQTLLRHCSTKDNGSQDTKCGASIGSVNENIEGLSQTQQKNMFPSWLGKIDVPDKGLEKIVILPV